jgi:putative MATE family efflux protein
MMRCENRETGAMVREIAALSWPTIVEQALQTVVQFADSAMVGRIGAQASACVGMTTSMTWLVNSPLFAMGVGVLATIARACGGGDQDTAKRAASQSILMTLVLGLALGALTVAISPFLPGWLGAEQALHKDGAAYFAIICAPMLFRAAIVLFGAVLRATGDMKTPMLVNVLINAVNVVLNFFLIFETRAVSFLGATFVLPGAGLGVVGAAMATAASYVLGGTLMFIKMLRSPAASPKGVPLRLDRRIMGACVRIGAPVALSRVGACLGQVVFSSQVTRLGTTALAAHSLALTAEQAFYIPGYGMQAAAATMCGNALGARDLGRLKRCARTSVLMASGVMALTGLALFLFPGFMMSLFTEDKQVIALGVSALRIVAVSEPVFGASIILEGVFDGIGDTRTPLLISIATMWGVRILLTYLCVNVLHLGLAAVWCCMVLDNVTRGALLFARYARGRWKQAVGLEGA